MPQRLLRPEGLGRDDLPGSVVFPGIDVQGDGTPHESAEGLEDPTLKVAIMLLVEKLLEGRDAEHHHDPLVRVAAQVRGDVVEPGIVGDHDGLAKGPKGVHPRKEIGVLDLFPQGEEVAERHLHEHDRLAARHVGKPSELGKGAFEHVEGDPGDRAEAAPLDEDRLVIEKLCRLDHLAVRGEHRCVGQPLLDEQQAHQPVVDGGEGGPGKLHHVHFHAVPCELVHEGPDEVFGSLVVVERAVDQVHPEDAERFLLAHVVQVPHPGMDDDLGGGPSRLGLEPDAQPAVAVLLPRVALGGHRVGEDEALRRSARCASRRSRSRPHSWSSIETRRCRLT